MTCNIVSLGNCSVFEILCGDPGTPPTSPRKKRKVFHGGKEKVTGAGAQILLNTSYVKTAHQCEKAYSLENCSRGLSAMCQGMPYLLDCIL